jgi:hypothetical protein
MSEDKARERELKRALRDADTDPVTGEPLYHGPPNAPRPGPAEGETLHPGSFGQPAPDTLPIVEPVAVDPERASDAARPAAEAAEESAAHPVAGTVAAGEPGETKRASAPSRSRDSKK